MRVPYDDDDDDDAYDAIERCVPTVELDAIERNSDAARGDDDDRATSTDDVDCFVYDLNATARTNTKACSSERAFARRMTTRFERWATWTSGSRVCTRILPIKATGAR